MIKLQIVCIKSQFDIVFLLLNIILCF